MRMVTRGLIARLPIWARVSGIIVLVLVGVVAAAIVLGTVRSGGMDGGGHSGRSGDMEMEGGDHGSQDGNSGGHGPGDNGQTDGGGHGSGNQGGGNQGQGAPVGPTESATVAVGASAVIFTPNQLPLEGGGRP